VAAIRACYVTRDIDTTPRSSELDPSGVADIRRARRSSFASADVITGARARLIAFRACAPREGWKWKPPELGALWGKTRCRGGGGGRERTNTLVRCGARPLAPLSLSVVMRSHGCCRTRLRHLIGRK